MQVKMFRTRRWIRIVWMRWIPAVLVILCLLQAVAGLEESHVCMEKQKYNVTKRIKYRAPMSVRTYEWCLAVPPRCSRWTTEMRDLTRLEVGAMAYYLFCIQTEERIMEVAVCCPGYVMKGVTCHPKCPSGRTGHNCTERCPRGRWGPSCSKECTECPAHASCSPYTGTCVCDDSWKGERCEKSTEEATTFQSASNNLLTTSTVTISNTQSTPLQISIYSAKTTKDTIETTSTVNPERINILTTIPTTPPPTATTTETAVTTTSAETTGRKPPVSGFTENTTKEDTNATNIFKLSTELEKQETNDFSMHETHTTKSSTWTVTDAPTSIVTHGVARIDVTVSTTPIDTVNFTKHKTPPLISKTSMATNKETTKLIKQVTAINETKPKEIWIKPTKGDSILFQSKNRTASMTVHKTIKIETTPRTIVVSIIPTSLDHTAVFKKITVSFNEHRHSVKPVQHTSKEIVQNKSMASSMWKIRTVTNPNERTLTTVYPQNIINATFPTKFKTYFSSTLNPLLIRNITKHLNITKGTKLPLKANYSQIKQQQITTKLTIKTLNISSANIPTVLPINASSLFMRHPYKLTTKTFLLNTTDSMTTAMPVAASVKQHSLTTLANRFLQNVTSKAIVNTTTFWKSPNFTTILSKHHQLIQEIETSTPKPETAGDVYSKTVISSIKLNAYTERVENRKQDRMGAITNLATTNHSSTTNHDPTNTELKPVEDEVFDILTEPEQITAIMERGSERNTDNLLSVLGIAGGVMFATITVGALIVMLERCRRTRFEDPTKTNEERQALEDDEEPPPYVRSIFHAPLPDPPLSQKSHYQPISTLDRNLKQFMRPVRVQSISPIMMENFRGILECHYDHLPPRNSHISFRSDTLPSQFRSSIVPSIGYASELGSQRSDTLDNKLPVTELSIETLKHEVAVEVVDPSTAEPLYAEIPCWRPTSQHAFEIVNLNGEAVTEL